jgi:2',3'-cyclic-nucleotide 2'-phosphodiesterase (5'-nucleotidase family)
MTLAALALFAGGCEPTDGDARPVILYGADNQGVLAACGCPSNPSGGLAKRQGLLEQYRGTRRHVLIVDAGNLMPDHTNPVKVKYLAQAVALAEYDAIGLGEGEFLLGVERLRDLGREYGLPLVCANVRTDEGEFVVPPHLVREVAGLRVGIFAVMADRAWGFPRREWREGLVVEPPLEAARREAQALTDCDVVVALAHLGLEESEALAREVEGLDLVVAGRTYHLLRTPKRIDGTLLVAPGPAGRVLGSVTLDREPDGGVRLEHDVTVLSAQIPDAKWVMDLYWKYVDESKDAPPPDWNQTPVPPRYETAETCKECHEQAYEQWRTTAHAHAYESVRKAGRHRDPECLLCHTMGLGREGGFVSMEKTPGLGRVTCQACHIVTSDHKEKGVKPDPRMSISSRLCMSCHGPVQSPDFDYYRYKPKILHTTGDGDRTDR